MHRAIIVLLLLAADAAAQIVSLPADAGLSREVIDNNFAWLNGHVNDVAYSSNPAVGTIPLVTAMHTVVYTTMPTCAVLSFTGSAFQCNNAVIPASHSASHGISGADPASLDASQIVSGTIPSVRLPLPGANTVGAVRAADCSSSAQFVQKVGTDGIITCATPAGSGNVNGPGSSTATYVPQWSGTTGTLLTTGLAVVTTLGAVGSDSALATEKAVRAAIPTTMAPSGSAGGDLSGTYPSPMVARVNGVSYGASPALDAVPVVTAAGVTTYRSLASGLQKYSTSTHAFAAAVAGTDYSPALSSGAGIGMMTDPADAAKLLLYADTTYIPTKADVQSGALVVCRGTSSGTSPSCAMEPSIASYSDGMTFLWIPGADCSGSPTTLNIDTLGAVGVYEADGAYGSCRNGVPVWITYTSSGGSKFRKQPATPSPSSYALTFDGSSTNPGDGSTLTWSSSSTQYTTTYTVPAGVYWMRVRGCAGGGGGQDGFVGSAKGGGGGGGCYEATCATTPGASVSIAVGKGGARGGAHDGGNTSWGTCFTLVGGAGANGSAGCGGYLYNATAPNNYVRSDTTSGGQFVMLPCTGAANSNGTYYFVSERADMGGAGSYGQTGAG